MCANSSNETTPPTKATVPSCKERPSAHAYLKTLQPPRAGTGKGRSRRLAGAVRHPGARAGLHRQGERAYRRAADRGAHQAGDRTVGSWRVVANSLESTATSPIPWARSSQSTARPHNDGVLTPIRRTSARRSRAYRHQPARCLRAWPHHRRLSPGGAVWRGFLVADKERERHELTIAIPPRTCPPARELAEQIRRSRN